MNIDLENGREINVTSFACNPFHLMGRIVSMARNTFDLDVDPEDEGEFVNVFLDEETGAITAVERDFLCADADLVFKSKHLMHGHQIVLEKEICEKLGFDHGNYLLQCEVDAVDPYARASDDISLVDIRKNLAKEGQFDVLYDKKTDEYDIYKLDDDERKYLKSSPFLTEVSLQVNKLEQAKNRDHNQESSLIK